MSAACSSVMATPAMVFNKGAEVMNTPSKLRPDLEEVVKDILALRAMAKTDNFLTYRSQRKILARLNAKDLAAVARALTEAERAVNQ